MQMPVDDMLAYEADQTIKSQEPSQYGGWKPRPHYHWTDLVCGKDYVHAEFIARQRPDWNLLAVDMKLDSTRTLGNLDLVRGNLHETLDMLADSSVGVFNADLCFDDQKELQYGYALLVLPILAKKIENSGTLQIRYRQQAYGYIFAMINNIGILKPKNFEIIDDKPCESSELAILREKMRASTGDSSLSAPMRLTARLAR